MVLAHWRADFMGYTLATQNELAEIKSVLGIGIWLFYRKKGAPLRQIYKRRHNSLAYRDLPHNRAAQNIAPRVTLAQFDLRQWLTGRFWR